VIAASAVALLVATLVGAGVAGKGQRAPSASASPSVYDVVIRNGRVLDPESGLDAVRSVGVTAGVISAISTQPLAGRLEIDATGLVVAPGFIDVVWEMPRAYERIQLLDGVTTAFQMWIGTDEVDRWYAEREGRALTNFGVAVGHEPIRRVVMRDPGRLGAAGDALSRAATDAEMVEIRRHIERGLAHGSLAVWFSHILTPAASGWETLEVFRAAKRADAVVWAPSRGVRWDIDDMPRFLTELIGAAAATGAALNVVHVQASGPDTLRLLTIIDEARAQRLDVTADVFPYSANMSLIKFVDAEDWPRWPDEAFRDLEWLETGERLTRESYGRYREKDGFVIVHNNHIEPLVTQAVARPITMIFSAAFVDERGRGHPRTSGTHARVLGHYVREKRVLSLREAVRKMTLMPAQRFQGRLPAMKNKGRIREGTDADVVVFDAGRIIDRATFQKPTRPSEGVRYVLINGVLVVRDGVVQDGVFAGRPVRAPSPSTRGSK
jgi:hypothetical protein